MTGHLSCSFGTRANHDPRLRHDVNQTIFIGTRQSTMSSNQPGKVGHNDRATGNGETVKGRAHGPASGFTLQAVIGDDHASSF